MMKNELEVQRYPIGRFQSPPEISDVLLKTWIDQLRQFPDRLSDLVTPLDDTQLDTPYRPDGWTVRQVVHHLSDSHHNSYIRFKWALTEASPLIKVYDEKAWAALFDSRRGPVQLSLAHLKAVHEKLVYLLEGLGKADLARSFVHPESGPSTLGENVGRYVWHGNHHYAHIENLLRSRGW
ncbi:MAG: putative metal-dependent hydrolase [Robiginitalea sp.]|jgi:hypothetical protein